MIRFFDEFIILVLILNIAFIKKDIKYNLKLFCDNYFYILFYGNKQMKSKNNQINLEI